jgi:hypothetical protein
MSIWDFKEVFSVAEKIIWPENKRSSIFAAVL